MVDYLTKETVKQERESEVLAVLNITFQAPSSSLYSLIFRWLNQENNYAKTEALTSFFEKIYYFQLDGHSFEGLDFSFQSMLEEKNLYTGPSGLRSAALRFLYEQSKKKNGEIHLFSDQNMDWMICDEEFSKTWAILMAIILKNNNKIKIIHNFNRDGNELFYALERWLPLYFAGTIESYYIPSSQKSSFTHTIFLSPGDFGIRSSSHVNALDSALYPFSQNSLLLSSWEKEFETMLEEAQPLLHFFTSNQNDDLEVYVGFLKSAETISFYLRDIPLWILSHDELELLLKEQHVSSKRREEILRYHQTVVPQLMNGLKEGIPTKLYIEMSSESLLKATTISTHMSALCQSVALNLSASSYLGYLKKLLDLENKYHCLSIHPVVDPKFPGLSMEVLGEYSLVHKLNDPPASLAFHHNYLCETLCEFMKKSSGKSPYKLGEILEHINTVSL